MFPTSAWRHFSESEGESNERSRFTFRREGVKKKQSQRSPVDTDRESLESPVGV